MIWNNLQLIYRLSLVNVFSQVHTHIYSIHIQLFTPLFQITFPELKLLSPVYSVPFTHHFQSGIREIQTVQQSTKTIFSLQTFAVGI